MKIVEYAKAHPWATGAVVVIGGIIFFMIVSGGSGSGSSGTTASGPSDAEIAANAQIQAAQIQATANASAANAQVAAAQIGAGVQLNSDNKAAEVAMATIAAEKEYAIFKTQSDNLTAHEIQLSNERINNAQGIFAARNAKNQAKAASGGFLGQVSGVLKSAAPLAGLFSDQRVKENIRLVGEDAKGRNVYEFNYKGSNRAIRGYIAQDLARSNPEIVYKDPATGFLKLAHM